MDPNLILTLARDNKATELAALIQQQGTSPNAGNKVCRDVVVCCAGLQVELAESVVAAAVQMGQTALHVAALWGNQDAIRVLIQLGANVNQTNVR